jgi:hypothetical protein
VTCSLCGRPGRTWTLSNGSESWTVGLCPRHAAPLAPLTEAGRRKRRRRSDLEVLDELWVGEDHPDWSST